MSVKFYFFNYESYTAGLLRHFLIASGYSALFIAIYFFLPNMAEWELEKERFLFQRNLSRGLVLVMVFHLFAVIFFRRRQTVALFRDYFSGVGSPYNLAFFRIFYLLVLMELYGGWALPTLVHWSELPYSERQTLPFMDWLIYNIPINPELYRFAVYAALICCFLGVVGFKTRWALWLHVPLVVYIFGVPNFFGKLNHTQVHVWMSLILAASPCGEILSVDSRLKQGKQQNSLLPPPDAVQFSLPFKFIWLLLAHIYLWGGIFKLWVAGLDWALSDSMIHQLQWEWVEQYDSLPAIRIDQFPWLCKLGGLWVIYMELLFPFLIFKSKTRLLAFIDGMALHKFAGYFMQIGFIDLQRCYVALMNWQSLFSLKNRWVRIPAVAFIAVFLGFVFQTGMSLLFFPFYLLWEWRQWKSPSEGAYLFPRYFAVPMVLVVSAMIFKIGVIGYGFLIYAVFEIVWLLFKKQKPVAKATGDTAQLLLAFPHRLFLIPDKIGNNGQKIFTNVKLLAATGFLLVIINGLCGLFQVHSFPFSSYPVYIALREGEISMLTFEAFDAQRNAIAVDSAAYRAGFRKENVRPLEEGIVADLEIIAAGKMDSAGMYRRIADYWNLWRINVPELQRATRVTVYLDKTPVAPEKRHQLLERKKAVELIFAKDSLKK